MRSLFPYGAAGLLILAAGVCAQESRSDQSGVTDANSPVVRTSRQSPKDTRDGRTTIGGVVISMPRHGSSARSSSEASAAALGAPQDTAPAAPAARADGTIEVPLNTLGPGESLQHRREREAADRDFAQARANLARRQAEQPITTDAFGYPIRSGSFYRSGFGYYYLRYPNGLIHPITTTTTGFSDQLHGAALKNYSDAATANTGVLGSMHQDAIRAVGTAAAPPIAPAIEAQQGVQRDIQKDTLQPKAPKR